MDHNQVPARADRYLALLRGINVGGKNKLPMNALKELFSQAGCDDVRTYIQSGNVIFTTAADVAADLPNHLTALIAAQFGVQIPVILRTVAQLQVIVAANLFVSTGADETTLHVMFLADFPEAHRVATLNPDRSPPDTFVLRGQEIYLRLPNGAARSKLTNAYFDAKLATISTARNWRTVTTLLTMMEK